MTKNTHSVVQKTYGLDGTIPVDGEVLYIVWTPRTIFITKTLPKAQRTREFEFISQVQKKREQFETQILIKFNLQNLVQASTSKY